MSEIASRHPLVGLIDETSRLHGRLRSVFAEARRAVGLGESEMMVLNAVVEAEHPPTVAQIGRSLGHPRQLIQRAANSLRDEGLIAATDNPGHRRAPLLVATADGIALKRRADVEAHIIADRLGAALPDRNLEDATALLRSIREQLQAQLRVVEGTR